MKVEGSLIAETLTPWVRRVFCNFCAECSLLFYFRPFLTVYSNRSAL